MRTILSVATTFAMTTWLVSADQTINYPEDKPIFSIAFPDDWEVEAEESVSASSPDEEVNMELIALDAEELAEAIDLAKESLSEELKGIKWNGKPEKGELNGMDVTFINAKVAIEGVEMAINCAVFAPKGKDTFFMLFNIIPIESLEKHGKSVSKILNSVKAK